MSDFERRLLLILLWPILWAQARYIRRMTPQMPEPFGEREGITGKGPVLRILLAGDSGAAGVGVSSQDEALCGQLIHRLSQHRTVEWCLLAVNGLDSPGLVKLLGNAPVNQYDVVVLSMGANDATSLCTPRRWVQLQNDLADVIGQRFAPALLVHSAVPPMHACAALPQPLRWFMGRWAKEMNRQLVEMLLGHAKRNMHWHPATTTATGLAIDGMHPNSSGYALWAEGLYQHILATHTESLVGAAG